MHNKNRLFADGSRGTFEKISENLAWIKQEFPDYMQKIRFNTVLDPTQDLDCINTFFMESDTFSEMNVNANSLDDTGLSQKFWAADSFITQSRHEDLKLFLHYLGRYPGEQISKLTLQRNSVYTNLNQSMYDVLFLSDVISPGGPCIPGQKRLFVDVAGTFYPCERVPELPSARVGHVDSGFDYENARKILDIGALTEESCKNCWAIRHCTACFKFACGKEGLSAEAKLANCVKVKQATFNNLFSYITFLEAGTLAVQNQSAYNGASYTALSPSELLVQVKAILSQIFEIDSAALGDLQENSCLLDPQFSLSADIMLYVILALEQFFGRRFDSSILEKNHYVTIADMALAFV